MNKAIKISIIISTITLFPNFIKAIEEPLTLAPTHTHDLSDIDELDEDAYVAISDPIEPINRGIFTFNKGVDKVVIAPITKTYHNIVPDWGKERVSSFVQNLKEPINIINAIFQGDEELLSNSVGRFLTNTILGVGGLFDVAATQKDLQIQNTDFGLTLKKHGIDTGPYIVLPILGPSSLRDAPSTAADYYLHPINHKIDGYKVNSNTRLGLKSAEAIDRRDSLSDNLDSIEETSIDEYASIRSIYIQKR